MTLPYVVILIVAIALSCASFELIGSKEVSYNSKEETPQQETTSKSEEILKIEEKLIEEYLDVTHEEYFIKSVDSTHEEYMIENVDSDINVYKVTYNSEVFRVIIEDGEIVKFVKVK